MRARIQHVSWGSAHTYAIATYYFLYTSCFLIAAHAHKIYYLFLINTTLHSSWFGTATEIKKRWYVGYVHIDTDYVFRICVTIVPKFDFPISNFFFIFALRCTMKGWINFAFVLFLRCSSIVQCFVALHNVAKRSKIAWTTIVVLL